MHLATHVLLEENTNRIAYSEHWSVKWQTNTLRCANPWHSEVLT